MANTIRESRSYIAGREAYAMECKYSPRMNSDWRRGWMTAHREKMRREGRSLSLPHEARPAHAARKDART